MLSLSKHLHLDEALWEQQQERLKAATTLVSLVLAAWQLGMWVAKVVVEQELAQRAHAPTHWQPCSVCGHRLRSKGFEWRRIQTLVGEVHWQRRVGRCPNHCAGQRQVPLDSALGIAPYQQTSTEVQRLGCLLCVFLPFNLAACLLEQLSGVRRSDDSLWNWGQAKGKQAMAELKEQMEAFEAGQLPQAEALTKQLQQLDLAIGADGVMVPFRSQLRTPKGKTIWREVKVAILARLGHTVTRTGQRVARLYQRRLVAVLGNIDALKPRLMWEAHRQDFTHAPLLVWLCDGGKGFWRLYRECFRDYAIGVLDFYHAAGQLWRAAAAYLDGRTTKACWWFDWMRHRLRHGRSKRVVGELIGLVHMSGLSSSARETLEQVHSYLQDHLQHIDYRKYEKMGIPLGSGMVESACKWLIQQRFKGVGMRWRALV